MPVILRRFLNLSAMRHLPRVAPRLSPPTAVALDESTKSETPMTDADMSGKMVFDNERPRTADPRVPLEKKRPKRTVEDVITATRKMRANYFQKNNKAGLEFEAEKAPIFVEEDGFFGIPPAPVVNSSESNTSRRHPSIKVESGSQYFDGSAETPGKEEEIPRKLLEPPMKPRKMLIEKAEPIKKEKKKVVEEEVEDGEGKETYAFEVAMKIRRQLEGRADLAKDSKGFRIMTGSTPDWNTMTRAEMFNQLRKAIVYNADGILAINKPYGLACQGNQISIASSFKRFSNWLSKLPSAVPENDPEKVAAENSEKEEEEEIWCRLVHRLDRDTTGVLVMATKQAVAARLRHWFNERKVAKTYWAITKFVPKESEGIIDIPIYECEIASGIYRMNLVPAAEASRRKGAVKAVTRYKVLASNSSSCALVELCPETGVKHQLRCHLGLGLATPVLGDHKYSNSDSIKPQRLPPSMLQAFEMRQAKARSVPLHLHAVRLVLPEFVDGRTIVIAARPPAFFFDTARRLKLKLPNF